MRNAIWISAICLSFILGFIVGAKAIHNARALNQTIITKIQNVFRDSEPTIKYVDRIVEVPVIKYVSSSQRKPSAGEVNLFLKEDKTNELNLPEKETAITFKEKARERGFRCSTVLLDCKNKDGELAQHIFNAFDTEDDGVLFVYAKFDTVMRNIAVGSDYGYWVSVAEGSNARDSGVIIQHITYEY
jgi:hypothetical protein